MTEPDLDVPPDPKGTQRPGQPQQQQQQQKITDFIHKEKLN